MAPNGWVVKTIMGEGAAGVTYVLIGPTPNSDISFLIAESRDVDDRAEKQLETAAAKTLPAHPNLESDAPVRDIPGGKIIEQVTVSSSASTTQTTATAGPPAMIEWTYTVIVPNGTGFTAYDLSALLSMKQYMVDRGFVRSVMNTLKLN